MNRRIVAALSGALLVLSGTAAAQWTAVAFTVPLNLTQLSPDLAKVRVKCEVDNATGVSPEIDVPPDGSVVTTVTVYVAPISNSPAVQGRSTNYMCNLQGFPRSRDVWVELRQSNTALSTYPHVLLSPNPMPITGTFTL